ncbi:hypothetical protein OKW30_001393 [Paraburkholderia sp. Clong3]
MEKELSKRQIEQIAHIVQGAALKQENRLSAIQLAFSRLVGHLGATGVLNVAAFKKVLQTDSPQIPAIVRADVMAQLAHIADAIRDPDVSAPPTRQ